MNTSNTVTMSTREIAELTGKRHDNVLRDARAVAAQTNALTSEAIDSVYTDGRGRAKPMMVLDKHLTFTLITGYDTCLRHNVIGRWIELEQAANPTFAAQAISETLNDLQSRVQAMTPAYDEHVRKGRTVGYSWREACRLAGIDHPDKLLDLLISRGRARKNSQGHTELHPDYQRAGHIKLLKPSNLVVAKNGGHLFKITSKGLTEWLKAKAAEMNKAVAFAGVDQWGRPVR
jgi:phage regulator Rha-like protein